MSDAKQIFFSNAVRDYNENGYALVDLFNSDQLKILEDFATGWIYRLLAPWVGGHETEYPLNMYHVWAEQLPKEHRTVFKALNRYQYPEPLVRDSIINDNMIQWLKAIGVANFKVWDDGWGNVGFRLVRPGVNDGYPLCAKSWGIAKNVVSFWIPIIGRSSRETLTVVPGSHKRDYPKAVSKDQFAAGEPRFAGNIDDLKLIKPMVNLGQAICYSSNTLHSEDVVASDITRLNLEIRFQPN